MADPHRSPPVDALTKKRICQRIREGLSVSQTAESLGRKKPQIAKAVQEMGGVETIRKGLVVLDGGQPSLPDPPPAVSDTAEHLRSEAALLRGMADRLEAIANAIERQPFEHPDLVS